jgi:hypothetical protein
MLDLLDAQSWGTLVLFDEAGEIDARIRFESGIPTGAHSVVSEPGLLQILIPLCARTHGGFMFLDGKSELGYGPGVVIGQADPLSVIAAAMRGPTREDAIDGVLAQLAGKRLQINHDIDFERFGHSAQERSLVALLADGPISLEDMQSESSLPARVVRRVVYQLSISGALTPLPEARRSSTMLEAPQLPPPPPVPKFSDSPTKVFPEPALGKAPATLLEQRNVSGVVMRTRRSRPPPMLSQPAVGAAGRYSMHEPEHGWTEVPAVDAASDWTSTLPPALLQWRKEILERRRCVERQTYFEMLGVPTLADDEAIDRAFVTLSDRFRPEQLPDALASMRETAAALHDYLIEAHETLLDAQRRGEYVRQLSLGLSVPAAPPRVQHMAAADGHGKKAEQLLKGNDYAGALQEATRAFQLDPTPSNEAFYGWLVFLRHSATGQVHPVARRHLQRALQRDNRCEQAHFYTACMLKQLGQEDEAYEHFKRALRLNSDNTEAQREVRIYENKRRSVSGEPGSYDDPTHTSRRSNRHAG